ncbi:MAG: TonB-dependent receptor plug domain-containing protein [Tannerella sp.]|jgi:iron complex outermembrane receptor protein|nr:TonB-dependent receptor plug domain-containing protein [Tannerella sp.]
MKTIYLSVSVLFSFCLSAQNTVGIDDGKSNHVEASKDLDEVEVFYRIKNNSLKDTTANLGYWKGLQLLDVPFSMTTISGDAMKNLQVTSLNEMSKHVPSMQIEARGGFELGRPQTRGFQGSVVETSRLDGLNIVSTTSYPMEQIQNLEIINGLAGSLYGPAAPSGSFNYSSKRVSTKSLTDVSMYYQQTGITGVHGDISRYFRSTNGYFGFRSNILYADGEGFAVNSNLNRWFVSSAFDAKIGNLKIETNFGRYNYKQEGYPGGFSYSSKVSLPKNLDPVKAGYGQEWAGADLRTITASARMIYTFNGNWSITAGILNQLVDRLMVNPSNSLIDENLFRQTVSLTATAGRFKVLSNMVSINGKVKTGTIDHNLIFGTNGFSWGVYGTSANSSVSSVIGDSINIYSPVIATQPATMPNKGSHYQSGDNSQQTINIGDNIRFSEHWLVLLSASYSMFNNKSYSQKGEVTNTYKDGAVNYSASLLYKPSRSMTVYATYSDVTQTGPSNTLDNVTTVLDPIRCTQYEIGYKASIANMVDFSMAAFRINRPFAFLDPEDKVFKLQGDQVNTGLELNGDLNVKSLHVMAGITFLDPKLKSTKSEETSNKQVVGVPKVQSNVFAEYRLPLESDISINGNFHYTGKKASNDTNTAWIDGYATFDLGARYTVSYNDKKIILNVQASNILNEKYWGSIFPSSINGDAGSYSAFMGNPREIKASVRVVF